MGRGSKPLLIVVLLGTLANAQDVPFPKPGSDPSGRVVDERGKPIVGARVELVEHGDPGRTWQRAIDQVLRQAPLPFAISDRDGEYVLPLTREQRRLGAGGEGSFTLHIEKDGYAEWDEPLPMGISGYLGSHAVLRQLAPDERVRVYVEDPVPGMTLVVRLVTGDAVQNSVMPMRVARVPEDGKLELSIPLLPSPTLQGRGGLLAKLSLEAFVAWPGRTTTTTYLDPDRENTIPRAETQVRSERKVSRSDGKDVVGLEGLYRFQDGVQVWLPILGSVAREDQRMALAALRATGCRVTKLASNAKGTEVQLAAGHHAPGPRAVTAPQSPTDYPLAENPGRLRIRVLDEDRKPLPGVTLRFADRESTRECFDGPPWNTDERGIYEFPALPATELTVMAADEDHLAKSCKTTVVAGLLKEQEIVLETQVTYRLRSTTASGKPAPFVAFRDLELLRRQQAQRVARPLDDFTDSLGRAWVRRKPQETVQILAMFSNTGRAGGLVEDEASIQVPDLPPLCVRFRTGSSIEHAEWQSSRGSSSSSGGMETEKAFGALLRPFQTENDLMILAGKSLVPILIHGSEITEGGTRRGGVVVVDRRATPRKIPLRLPNTHPAVLKDLRIVPRTPLHGGAMLATRMGNMLGTSASGTPELLMTTPASIPAVVLHKGFLRADVVVPEQPARGAQEAELEIKLTPGSSVSFRFDPIPPGTGRHVSVQLRSADGPNMLWYASETLEKQPGESNEVGAVLDLPFALPAGSYALTITAQNQNRNLTFEVDGSKPKIVDVGKKAEK